MTAEQGMHRPHGMQSGRGDVNQRNCVAVDSGRQDSGDAQCEETDRVSEAFDLVGAIPCLMQCLVQDKGCCGKSDGGQANRDNPHHDDEPRGKRAQILSSVGREIIGLRYSRGPIGET
jgi:hypothetical protein